MIAVIINPISGGPRRGTAAARVDLAAAALRSAGEPGDVFLTERRGHGRELAAAAVERGARLVVAWGGDGTINEVGSALLHGDVPLAIVPAGSGNGFATELRISLKPAQALAEAFRAAPRPIDAGEMGGRIFFNIAGIGFDAHVAACFDRESSARRGFVTYARVSLRELRTYRSASYRIGEPGAPPQPAMLIALANAPQYGNGMRVAPRARLDDGKLDLVVFQERSRFATYCAIPRLFSGGAERVRGVTIRQVERAAIECDRPMTFHVDGEPVAGGTRVEARVLPAALRVCVR